MRRTAFRDFWRRRRVRKHFARHGDVFDYHGVEVRLPADVDIAAANALIRGKYEREEAELVLKHLPRDLAVIELGGSLGVVSALVRSRLAPGVKHVVVEANPALIQTCRANAETGRGPTEVVQAALFHDGPVARFSVGETVHSSALADAQATNAIEAPAVTLAELHRRVGSPDRFSLVCDVEGAEFDMFARERTVLAYVDTAIVELHPQSYRSRGAKTEDLLANVRRSGLEIRRRINDVVLLTRNESRDLSKR